MLLFGEEKFKIHASAKADRITSGRYFAPHHGMASPRREVMRSDIFSHLRKYFRSSLVAPSIFWESTAFLMPKLMRLHARFLARRKIQKPISSGSMRWAWSRRGIIF